MKSCIKQYGIILLTLLFLLFVACSGGKDEANGNTEPITDSPTAAATLFDEPNTDGSRESENESRQPTPSPADTDRTEDVTTNGTAEAITTEQITTESSVTTERNNPTVTLPRDEF